MGIKIVQIGSNKGYDDLTEIVKKFNNDEIELLLLIEPHEEFNDSLSKCYQGYNFIIENVVINTDENTEDVFFYSCEHKEISSLIPSHLDKHAQFSHKKNKFKSITLNNLFKKYNLYDLDILFIDAEGFDDKIIYSINFKEFLIKKIYYENLHIDVNQVSNFLIGKNFSVTKNILSNGWTDLAEKQIPKKLHLGCGDKKLPNFLNVDIRDLDSVDLIDDISELNKIKNFSFDLIYCCHVLEHFGRHEYMKILKNWYEKLNDGGILRISVPSFESIVEHYNDNGDLKTLIGLLYGGQTYSENYHKCIWDFKSLEKDLLILGFKIVKKYDWWDTDYSFIDDYSQSYLPHMDKKNGKLMSLNIEAIK
jgi:hypothetical protein